MPGLEQISYICALACLTVRQLWQRRQSLEGLATGRRESPFRILGILRSRPFSCLGRQYSCSSGGVLPGGGTLFESQ